MLTTYISQYSALLPIIFFLLFTKKIKGWELWVSLFYILYAVSVVCILTYCSQPYPSKLLYFDETNFFLVYSYSIILLPLIATLLIVNKVKHWPLLIILLYCAYSFSNDQTLIYRSGHKLPIRKFLYYYTIVEYLTFAVYFLSILKNRISKKVLIGISIAFTAYCLYYIFTKAFKKFDSVQTSIEAIVVIVFSLIYLFEEINKPQVAFIYSSYKFWIVIGMFLYMAGTFFLFIYASALSKTEVNNFWIINYIANILKNVLFALAIIMHAKERPVQKAYPRMPLHVLN